MSDNNQIWVEAIPTKAAKPETFFHPVWHLIGADLWVAGGSVNRWLEGRQTNPADIDLFSANPEQAAITLKEQAKLSGGDLVRESFLAFTYKIAGKEVQLIKRPYATLKDVIRSFDFTARMVGLDGSYLFFHPDAKSDILNKRIVFHKGDFSITTTSLFGLVKYGNRGYHIDHPNAYRFMKAWGVPAQNLTSDYQPGVEL